MDESGNTGQDLLDDAQPVFALAAVQLESGLAEETVERAKATTRTFELKFSSLRKSTTGQAAVLGALDEVTRRSTR